MIIDSHEHMMLPTEMQLQMMDAAGIDKTILFLSLIHISSGAQIMLAKLILSGAANLVCITILLFMETSQQNSCKGIGQVILYCLVPYLVCMVGLRRVIRMRKKEGLPVCVFIMLGSCVFWGLSANALPWLYEATATGLWLIMFVVFSAFFLQEIRYIAAIRKEGKMYGIIA